MDIKASLKIIVWVEMSYHITKPLLHDTYATLLIHLQWLHTFVTGGDYMLHNPWPWLVGHERYH